MKKAFIQRLLNGDKINYSDSCKELISSLMIDLFYLLLVHLLPRWFLVRRYSCRFLCSQSLNLTHGLIVL